MKKSVEEVLHNLRAKGIRITDTRRAVLSHLVASHEHPSAEKIYRDLLPQFPSMSLATVYNNIVVLIDEVVSEIKVRNDTTTYFDFMGHDHLNVVCENVAVSQMWTLKSQIFAKKQRVKAATRSPRPRWPSMAFALTVENLMERNQELSGFLRNCTFYIATRFFTENLVE